MTGKVPYGYEECLEIVIERLQSRPSVLELGPLTAAVGLRESGIDSIDLIVVFAEFEERTGVEFDNDVIDPEVFETIGDLAAFFVARLN